MAIIIITPPDAAANSYCTLAEAETFMEGILNNSEWDAAIDDTKNRALVEATSILDPLSWKGTKTDSLDDNALRWPRTYVYNQDCQLYSSSVVPNILKKATSILAFELIKSDRLTDVGLDAENGVKIAKVGPLLIENFEGNTDGTYLTPIPSYIMKMIASLLRSNLGAYGVATLVRA